MNKDFSYQDYVGDAAFLTEYNEYQQRYADGIRESDKVIVAMVGERVDNRKKERLKILDIGCSTGNLLLHLKRAVPDADYIGGDLAQSSLRVCRQNRKLEGVTFHQMDVLDLPCGAFDIIIVNAVLYLFDDAQLFSAMISIFNGLKTGGQVIVYDFAHPFKHQNVIINETSRMHPHGLRICFRSMESIEKTAKAAGFKRVVFRSFDLPIDLAMPGYDEEVVTYTVPRQDGSRMMFRGVLYQPWCHMIIEKQ
jgi:SAM-dependent methyltransferase